MNHMRTHKAGLRPGLFGSPTTAASSLPDGTDTATRHAHDGDSDDGFGDGLGDDPNRVLVPTVAEYLARLYDDGDLDITRVREFVGGANAVSCPADTKVVPVPCRPVRWAGKQHETGQPHAEVPTPAPPVDAPHHQGMLARRQEGTTPIALPQCTSVCTLWMLTKYFNTVTKYRKLHFAKVEKYF